MRKVNLILLTIIVLFCAIYVRAQSLEYVGSTLWTSMNDVFASDTLAYCIYQSGLQVIDISNPNLPMPVGKLELPYGNYSIDISDTLAYLGCQHELKIISIANSAAPYLISTTWFSWDHYPMDIKVAGNYLYIVPSDRGSIIIYDIHDPLNPQFLHMLSIGGFMDGASCFSIADQYLYIGRYIYHGNPPYGNYVPDMGIYDISDPSNPLLMGIFSTNSRIGALYVRNSIAYLAAQDMCFSIINVADPSNPILIGQDCQPRVVGMPSDLYLDDQYIYIILGDGSNGWAYLLSYDVHNNINPQLTHTSNIGPTASGSTFAGSLIISSHPLDGLRITDISDPNGPNLISTFKSPSADEDINTIDTMAYILSPIGGFFAVNISNPQNPTTIQQYNTPYYREFSDLFVNNSRAYLPSPEYGIYVFSLPNSWSFWQIDNTYDINRIFVADTIAYAYDTGHGRLKIIDVNNPYAPQLLSTYDIQSGHIYDVYVMNNFAYLSGMSSNQSIFEILDISEPQNPTLVGSLMTSSGHVGNKIIVVDTIAYIVGNSPALQTINVADSANPIELYHSSMNYTFSGIAISIPYAFVSNPNGGLYLFDVSADTFSLINTYPSNAARNVAYSNGDVYLADSYSLKIFHFNPTGIDNGGLLPNSFALSQSYPNPFNASATIKYDLPKASDVSIEIFDILGRKIETLVSEKQSAGKHSIIWNAKDATSGVYFYKIKAGEYSETKRCLLLK